MARIAEATCATCSHIRPRNEMREVSVNRKVGTRFGISHSRRSTRESASVQFRRQVVWVCKGCRAPRSDGLIPWKTLIVLALGAAAFMWFADASTKRTVARGVDGVISAADPHVNPATKGRDMVAALMPAPSDGAKAEPAPDEAGRDDARREVDWDAEAITAARVEALDRGKARRWKSDGAKGQVVPSEATMTDGTECRNVYATARIDGRDETSPTTTWCRPQGGTWMQRT
jgi:hypothetical protein